MRTGTNNQDEPVIWFPAVIVDFDPDNAVKSKGKNETLFYRVQCKVDYTPTKSGVVGALLWKPGYDKVPNLFKIGASIELEIQTTGEYQGRCKINLPGMAKFDFGAIDFTVEEEVLSTEAQAKADALADDA